MAKLTPFLGNISGKIAGNVFSSGKGGAYIRQFVKPTNANSYAQKRARAAFATASRAWSALSATYKSAWNSFAISYFSPKVPKPGVTYSGASAYASHNAQVIAANAALVVGAEVEATPAPLPLDVVPFIVSEMPPTGLFAPAIMNVTGDKSATLNLKSVSIVASNTPLAVLTVSMENSGQLPSDFSPPAFISQASGEGFGFGVYASARIPSGSVKPSQVQKFLVGIVQPVSVISPAELPDGPDWTFNLSLNPNLSESKYELQSGAEVLVDVYAISVSGASALIGSMQVSVG